MQSSKYFQQYIFEFNKYIYKYIFFKKIAIKKYKKFIIIIIMNIFLYNFKIIIKKSKKSNYT